MSNGESSGGRTPDGADGAGGANGGSSIPDEEWVRFLQDSERDIRGSAPKEPSARARMVTERLRQLDAEAEKRQGKGRRFRGGRGRKRAGGAGAGEGAWQPDGWRTGPAWQERNGRRAVRRRRIVSAVGIVVAVGLAVVAVNPDWALSRLPGGLGDGFRGSEGAQAAPATLPAETAAPTAAPPAEASETPTLEQPFRGSPAARYADGADGIVLPEAEAVGALSKEQVADALRLTKAYLVAANLEPATLRGERPADAIDLVDPQQPDVRDRMGASLRSPGEERDPLQYFSRFDPDEVRLVGDVVKTRGRMTFKEGEQETAEIHADYTFVYPLVKAQRGATQVARTIVRRSLVVQVHDPTKYQVTPGKLSFAENRADFGNSDCFVYDGFLHPYFAGDLEAEPSASGPARDPYDRSRPLTESNDGTCGTVSRT